MLPMSRHQIRWAPQMWTKGGIRPGIEPPPPPPNLLQPLFHNGWPFFKGMAMAIRNANKQGSNYENTPYDPGGRRAKPS
jgi:hypothetical protein